MQEMLPNKYAYLANLPLLACLERECGGKCRGIHVLKTIPDDQPKLQPGTRRQRGLPRQASGQ